jgi:type I restriction enzyme S subunit
MNTMNFLKKLLDGVDVEWQPLGDVGEFIRGNGMQKKDFVESGFPAIHYGQIHTKYSLSATKTFSYVSEQLARSLKKAKQNDLLLATTSENDEDVVKPLAWLGDQVVISGDMMLFRHGQDVKYLAYFFQTNEFQEQKRKYITGAKIRRVSSSDLTKIIAPIPCPENPTKSLEIQAEIVRVLDTFTDLTADLTAELTAELTARQKQYSYYRDQLLSFEEGEAEWKKLGEVCDFKNGFAFKSNLFRDNGLPIVRITNVDGRKINLSDVKYFNPADYREDTTAYSVEHGDILVAMSGATTGKIGFYDHKSTAYLNQRVGKFLPKKRILNNRYLYHYLLSKVDDIYVIAGGGAQPNLSSNALMDKIAIPIPYPDDPNSPWCK